MGLSATPMLGGPRARVPLLLELLSPAGRPLQTTRDLASFWENSYREVRKEMRAKYPKHVWPENPADAEATRLTKKQLAAAAEGGGNGGGGGGGSGSGGAGGKQSGLTTTSSAKGGGSGGGGGKKGGGGGGKKRR